MDKLLKSYQCSLEDIPFGSHDVHIKERRRRKKNKGKRQKLVESK
jgi:hypothetical protein